MYLTKIAGLSDTLKNIGQIFRRGNSDKEVNKVLKEQVMDLRDRYAQEVVNHNRTREELNNLRKARNYKAIGAMGVGIGAGIGADRYYISKNQNKRTRRGLSR